MGRLARLLALPPRDRRFLVRAALVVAMVRLGLSVLPFRLVWRAVTSVRAARGVGKASTSTPSVERVVWAVAAASRRVPRATCLTRAIAAHLLLARVGHPSRVRLGVGRDEHGRFGAHAWVEGANGALIGAPEPGRFTPLPLHETGAR